MHEPIVVTLPAELDLTTVAELRRAFDEVVGTSPGAVVVDLSYVEFIDSTGVGALLDLKQRLASESRAMPIVAPRGSPAAVVLTVSGLRSEFDVHPTRQAAGA